MKEKLWRPSVGILLRKAIAIVFLVFLVGTVVPWFVLYVVLQDISFARVKR